MGPPRSSPHLPPSTAPPGRLGKTLQGIALLWTLLTGGHALNGGAPLARRVVICCPTSLVANWDSECVKWLCGRVRTLPLCESTREEAVASVASFLSPRSTAQVGAGGRRGIGAGHASGPTCL